MMYDDTYLYNSIKYDFSEVKTNEFDIYTARTSLMEAKIANRLKYIYIYIMIYSIIYYRTSRKTRKNDTPLSYFYTVN